jgi:regulatory protein
MNFSVSSKKENPKKLILSFQGEFFREVDRSLFQKEIEKVDFASYQELNEWFFCLETKVAKKVALWLLAKRNYPRAALLQKLKRKGFEENILVPLLDQLEKKGWIDESFFLEKEVLRWAKKGFGPLAIQYKLEGKGYRREWVSKTIQTLLTRELQKEAIHLLLSKQKKVDKKKNAAFLMRRGYESFLIWEILS